MRTLRVRSLAALARRAGLLFALGSWPPRGGLGTFRGRLRLGLVGRVRSLALLARRAPPGEESEVLVSGQRYEAVRLPAAEITPVTEARTQGRRWPQPGVSTHVEIIEATQDRVRTTHEGKLRNETEVDLAGLGPSAARARPHRTLTPPQTTNTPASHPRKQPRTPTFTDKHQAQSQTARSTCGSPSVHDAAPEPPPPYPPQSSPAHSPASPAAH
ncbi:hypothetical protein ENSA7_41270 [Enhygromyxa salina]|uniref:Uncharacterized protein n=1 Tax=Enhygromyxa salina TaxID=215803 RepID=A0A2S9YLW6_9BACT|nr:hypothetical protein ENSA7_41270 [Enhygromyxa salina]